MRTETAPVELTLKERQAAIQYLRSPQLTQRILDDYARCGLVGEETNKLVCYLACVSRLLPKPLALLIQSGSAAGKTSLMDATLHFMPVEAFTRYSAMTGQSLYYMGQRSLRHKILAVAEEEGIAQASYAETIAKRRAVDDCGRRPQWKHRPATDRTIFGGRARDDVPHHHRRTTRCGTTKPLRNAACQ
ncbi:MAG: hypothetical protein R3E01_25610 [Pirellulaceae bacterium]